MSNTQHEGENDHDFGTRYYYIIVFLCTRVGVNADTKTHGTTRIRRYKYLVYAFARQTHFSLSSIQDGQKCMVSMNAYVNLYDSAHRPLNVFLAEDRLPSLPISVHLYLLSAATHVVGDC